MSTLYEIMDEMKFLEGNLIDDETGEIDELILSRLDGLEVEKKQKIENIACLIKSKRADADSVRTDMRNQLSRAESWEKSADALEKWLAQILDGEEFESTRCKVSFRESHPVEILDENVIPDEYMDIRVVRKPMKKLIKDAINSGKEVKGAIILDKQNIQVK